MRVIVQKSKSSLTRIEHYRIYQPISHSGSLVARGQDTPLRTLSVKAWSGCRPVMSPPHRAQATPGQFWPSRWTSSIHGTVFRSAAQRTCFTSALCCSKITQI